MIEILLIILIIVMVVVGVLLYLNLQELKKKKKTTETFSKHISLDGLSKTINSDADILLHLKEKEDEQKLDKEQKEVLALMTNNKTQTQYKRALAQTIKEIRSGNINTPERKEGMNNG